MAIKVLSPQPIEEDASETSPLLGQTQQNGRGNGQPVDPENTQPSPEEDPAADETALAEEPSTKKLVAIMVAIWIGVFFAALDTTIVATLTAPISSSFDSLSLLSWLATGYLIANSACQPLSGKLTDIFSRRWGLLFSNIFFAVGTLICGLAPNASTIIAGRVIAGIGGGGLSCISTFVTSDLIPLRRRGLWQGYGNLVFGLGMGSGGVFGGLLADRLSWRWAFLLQVPFIVVSAVLVWFLVDIPVNPSTKPALRRIDFLGSSLLVASLVLFLLGLNTGGNQLPWSHPLIITPLVLSLVILAVFMYLESHERWIPEPVLPVALIAKTRTVLFSCLANWFSTMSAFLALYYVPLYLQIRGLSSTSAGLRVIPFAAATSVGSLGVGYIMRSTGRYYWMMVAIMTIFVVGAALLCTFQYDTPAWATYVYVSPLGLGYGAMLTITLVAMISAVDHQHQAVITAASYAFRSTGSTIGITIASAVFQNILTKELRDEYGDMPGSEDVIRKIRNSLEGVKHLPAGWSRDVINGIYMDALRGAFIAGLGLAVLAAVAALGMKEHVLHKNLARK
ncbi:major facilitator superfamily domain-containing protein [Exophiala viscosa]|uniref:Major facilitator superfamily domain-containing protein n=1 Tax=Exophiala viscosa TaxID=2486360 RepID=A0AAN6DSK2_9EURO|nr:major facilitator superfamily domain-containing protein [Exophiala viscosa]